MAGTFHLDSVGLDPLSDLHNQVAAELGQLTGADAPQASDVASSFGTIAANVNASLDGALQSRAGTIQTTQRSSDTISGLLQKAHRMYTGTDQEGAGNIRSTARAFGDQPGGRPDSGAQRVKQAGDADPAGSPTGKDAITAAASGSSGSPNSPTPSGVPAAAASDGPTGGWSGGPTGGSSGAPTGGSSGGPTAGGSSGTPMAAGTSAAAGSAGTPMSMADSGAAGSSASSGQVLGQVLGQVGQQVGSLTQAVGQGVQSLGLTLGQLPGQLMQSVSQFSEMSGSADHGALGAGVPGADELGHRPESHDRPGHQPDTHDPSDHRPDRSDQPDHRPDAEAPPRNDGSSPDSAGPAQPQPPRREPPRTYPAAD